MRMTDEFAASCFDCSPVCGVYLLILRNRVVYIGSSINVHQRIALHGGSKEFDRAVCVPVVAKDLRNYEGALIRFFCPRYNEAAASPHSDVDDNIILARLGLPPHADDAAVQRAYRARFSRRRSAQLRKTRSQNELAMSRGVPA